MIRQGTNQLNTQLELFMAAKDLDSNDKFIAIMSNVHKTCESELTRITEKYDHLEKELAELSALYDEDKTAMIQKPEDFLGIVDGFLTSWKDSIQKKKEAETKKDRKTAPSPMKKPGMGPGPVIDMNEMTQKSGILNKLAQNMGDKKTYAERRTQRGSILQGNPPQVTPK
jgi:hypothetical protein